MVLYRWIHLTQSVGQISQLLARRGGIVFPES